VVERLTATYLIESRYPLEQAAAALAGEQSSGTFRPVPGETAALLARFGARVEAVIDQGEVAAPALPGSRPPATDPQARPRRGLATISWPLENTGPSLPAVWSTVLGNLFELHHFSAARLLDIRFPAAFAEAYRGPGFGIAGTRRLTGITEAPILGTIIKPSVGLSPEQTASLAADLGAAGLDFIKDDELTADPPHAPFVQRFDAVMTALDRQADRTGRRVMYAANITGELDAMFRYLDMIARRGGTCAMVVLNAVGLPAVAALRARAAVAIHGHRAGWGLYGRSPDIGMDYAAYQKFWRIAGVDHLHVNGLRNKFCEDDASVIRSARTCLTPLFDRPGAAFTVMPVFSSAQSADQVADTYAAIGTTDLIYCCGGGIMAHPHGPAAGVASLREAWTAARAGIAADEYARDRPALAAALEAFR